MIFFLLLKKFAYFYLLFDFSGSLLLQGLFSSCSTWALGAQALVVVACGVSGNWCMDF